MKAEIASVRGRSPSGPKRKKGKRKK